MGPVPPNDPQTVSPDAALARLLEGNRRFIEDRPDARSKGWHADLVQAQRPFAAVLGCSDSRAPAELIFDQGLGDLFMIRVAGNIVAPSLIGSVEFAVAQIGVRLVMVMGHTQCGAIRATFDALRAPDAVLSKNLEDITRRIEPQIESLLLHKTGGPLEPATLRAAERANVLGSVQQLKQGSPYLEPLVRAGSVRIVGAIFELETGRVALLE